MLLYWEALKLAIATGDKLFDFGRCTIDSGTYRFKNQWGAQACQLHWDYWPKLDNRCRNSHRKTLSID
jgi:lipid II:glycine glycyltransferase (peptidoglycan interpeptide bridge formation enzyme)